MASVPLNLLRASLNASSPTTCFIDMSERNANSGGITTANLNDLLAISLSLLKSSDRLTTAE
ncbi:hypothetical protein [Archaeoglobus sp.]